VGTGDGREGAWGGEWVRGDGGDEAESKGVRVGEGDRVGGVGGGGVGRRGGGGWVGKRREKGSRGGEEGNEWGVCCYVRSVRLWSLLLGVVASVLGGGSVGQVLQLLVEGLKFWEGGTVTSVSDQGEENRAHAKATTQRLTGGRSSLEFLWRQIVVE